MPHTLLSMCVRALDRISSFNVPNFIVGNEDDTAKTLLACAKDVGEELVRDHDWQELFRTATVNTVASTSLYDLPADYEKAVPDTMWNTETFRRMKGATPQRSWAAITNSQVDPGLTFFWRLYGKQIQLEPAPSSIFTFNYEYLSNRYCTDADGDEIEEWTNDTDQPILRHDLYVAGIRYYFLKSKNLPYGDAAAEYDAILSSRQSSNVPTEAINLAANIWNPYFDAERRFNIPDRVDS